MGAGTEPDLALVIDASVGLKWVLQEPDDHAVRAACIRGDPIVSRMRPSFREGNVSYAIPTTSG